MKIASIDIGCKNFCIYIEEHSILLYRNMKCPDVTHNYDGSPTTEMRLILEQIYTNGKSLYHDNIDLTKNSNCFNDICHNMYTYLTSIKHLLDDCEYVVIEQQMTRNVKAFKLAQNCASFFIFTYDNAKNVIEFPSYHKTCVLGAPRQLKTMKSGKQKWKTLSQASRKKWSIEKALEILAMRNEKQALENIKSKKKRDDLADTITMCQAFKYINFIKNKK